MVRVSISLQLWYFLEFCRVCSVILINGNMTHKRAVWFSVVTYWLHFWFSSYILIGNSLDSWKVQSHHVNDKHRNSVQGSVLQENRRFIFNINKSVIRKPFFSISHRVFYDKCFVLALISFVWLQDTWFTISRYKLYILFISLNEW